MGGDKLNLVWGDVLNSIMPSSVTLDHSHPQWLRDYWFWSEICWFIPEVNIYTKSKWVSFRMKGAVLSASVMSKILNIRVKLFLKINLPFWNQTNNIDEPVPNPTGGFFFNLHTVWVLFCESSAEWFNKYSSPNSTNFKSFHPNLDWSKSLLVMN